MANKFLTNKKEISKWLDCHGIAKYELVADDTKNDDGSLKYGFVIDVNDDVKLYNMELTHIPVKFNIINGSFDCNNNKLTGLGFAPKEVKGDFYCQSNELTTLIGGPEIVHGDFYCHGNRLQNLEGCPEIVNGHFDCCYNELTTLQFIPDTVGGEFWCYNNELLVDRQKISNFKDIYEEHLKDKIIAERKLISNELNVVNKNRNNIIKV